MMPLYIGNLFQAPKANNFWQHGVLSGRLTQRQSPPENLKFHLGGVTRVTGGVIAAPSPAERRRETETADSSIRN